MDSTNKIVRTRQLADILAKEAHDQFMAQAGNFWRKFDQTPRPEIDADGDQEARFGITVDVPMKTLAALHDKINTSRRRKVGHGAKSKTRQNGRASKFHHA